MNVTDLRNQRRLAAELLGCGENRVWIDPLHTDDVAEAVTRQDVRSLINRGLVDKKQKKGSSRSRARKLQEQKDKGRRQGPGSRKGSRGARESKKTRWMRTIRPIRRTLRYLRDEGHLDPATYRTYYRQAKGGVFRSRNHLIAHLKTDGAIADDLDVPRLDPQGNPMGENGAGGERELTPEEDLEGAGGQPDTEEA